MDQLLDPNLPTDEFLALLEQPVQLMYNTSGDFSGINKAQSILTRLQDMPTAWQRVDKILDSPNSSLQAKFIGLQILERLIQYRWKTLDRDTATSIRNYVVEKVVSLSSTDESYAAARSIVTKLNVVLVQIVKQEWPHNWKGFISELAKSSLQSMSLCYNNLSILTLLSEEVFEFSGDQMVQEKAKTLKEQLNQDFQHIYQLCFQVFGAAESLASTRPKVVKAALSTLSRYISWIPLGYVFETEIMKTAVLCLGLPNVANEALRCCVEIANLPVGNAYDSHYRELFKTFMEKVGPLVPQGDLTQIYDDASEEEQAFIKDLALFFTGLFKNHLSLFDRDFSRSPEADAFLHLVLQAHECLLRISRVNDVEVFKTCLEWWNRLAADLYDSQNEVSVVGSYSSAGDPGTGGYMYTRRILYRETLSAARNILIDRMAKPEEVLVVPDDSGGIIRETIKDTDSVARYKAMRETLVFLTYLDQEDTQSILRTKLSQQKDDACFSWNAINTISWAIGSISGALNEYEERRFLVFVIKDLLQLCEEKQGKDNKAIVASNIMYVVGQYPRFLRQHWKFLKTVVKKLFEFMHETHPGVQDMACDTLYKIVQTCKAKFLVVHPPDERAFIYEMLETIPDIIRTLEDHQIQSFFKSAGCIIATETDRETRSKLVLSLFALPNQSWQSIIYQGQVDESVLRRREKMKSLIAILKTNSRAAGELGDAYLVQLEYIFTGLLTLYKLYSGFVSKAVAESGPIICKSVDVRAMLGIKRETLNILINFVKAANPIDNERTTGLLLQPLNEAILGDYLNSAPEGRLPEVLSLYSHLVEYTRGNLPLETIIIIFQSLVNVTLDMIKSNFEDFPDSRISLFGLLRAISKYNFQALFKLNPDPARAEEEFGIVITAITWAIKHTEKNVAETGLITLTELLSNVDGSQFVNYFYRTYMKKIIVEVLAVLTDTMHKPGFRQQAEILQHAVIAIASDAVTEPIWNSNAEDIALASSNGSEPPSNCVYFRNYLIKTLKVAFPNLSHSQIDQIVDRLLNSRANKDDFRGHLRDFLIQTKEFSGGDNQDMFDSDKQALQNAKSSEGLGKHAEKSNLIAPAAMQTNGMAV